MNDTISRSKTLDAFADYVGGGMSMNDFDALWKIVEKMPPVREWIPVSERLPEEDGQYLITVKYKHVDGYDDIYAEHGEWTDGRWDMFCFGHCGEVENIIAWMPLPEPFEEECDNVYKEGSCETCDHFEQCLATWRKDEDE